MRFRGLGRRGGWIGLVGGWVREEVRNARFASVVAYWPICRVGVQLESRKGSLTRVVCSTFASRGKSLTPESRMEMLEERRVLVDRREETHDEREFAIV